MAALRQITTAPGLTFNVLVDGPEQGAPVLLLHGFAESFHHWDAQIAALARSGYRAFAPSQRGYSPGARPDPANTDNYVFDRLVDDPMQIAAQLRLTGFHLVGHDWVAASPGASRTNTPTGSRRSPSCRARIRTRSIVRWSCPRANRNIAHVITANSSSPALRPSCWQTMPNGCACAGMRPACRRPRRRGISPCSAIAPPWRRRSPGIGHGVLSALRSV